MADTYISKNAWHFQYKVPNPSPRRTALLAQGCTESATAIEEEDDAGVEKVIFPGSSNVEASSDPVLIDSYSETNVDDFGGLDANTSREAQSFTATARELSSVKFYLKKTGTVTGTVNAKLYAHSGTFGQAGSVPTGSVLATSDNFDSSTLTASYQLIELTFTGAEQYQLVDGTKYFISLEGTIAGGGTLAMGIDASSSTHGGWSTLFSAGAWADFGPDHAFYVYGT